MVRWGAVDSSFYLLWISTLGKLILFYRYYYGFDVFINKHRSYEYFRQHVGDSVEIKTNERGSHMHVKSITCLMKVDVFVLHNVISSIRSTWFLGPPEIIFSSIEKSDAVWCTVSEAGWFLKSPFTILRVLDRSSPFGIVRVVLVDSPANDLLSLIVYIPSLLPVCRCFSLSIWPQREANPSLSLFLYLQLWLRIELFFVYLLDHLAQLHWLSLIVILFTEYLFIGR